MHEHTDTRHHPHEASRTRLAEWGFGILGGLTALLVPLALLAVPSSEMVAIVAPPGAHSLDLARIIAEADGAIVSAGRSDNIMLARSDSDGFVSRLYAAGARLVIDAGTAKGCSPAAARPASISIRALP